MKQNIQLPLLYWLEHFLQRIMDSHQVLCAKTGFSQYSLKKEEKYPGYVSKTYGWTSVLLGNKIGGRGCGSVV